MANMESHQPWCLFPLLRALEKMCPLDPTLDAMPRGELLAAEVEPVVPWLGAQADLSLSLPDALLRIREVSPNKSALHLKANLQSLHHQDRPDVLGFFVVIVSTPTVAKQVVPRRRCRGDLLAKVMQAAAHHIYCDKWHNIQSTPLLEDLPRSSSLFRHCPARDEIVFSDVLSWYL